ncbi:MAG TPA: glycosyltransferase family 9 protein [Candidatus Ozemobacteraceae bacterium]|nr:glycosyltransferase family 9 protein [Candidatus Ozemobacteraceae bacterium]
MPGTLIIRLKGMGDIVHLLPSLEMLAGREELRPVSLLCQAPFGDIVPDDMGVEVVPLPAHATAFQTVTLLRRLRKRRFDRLFDLFANPRTALISFLSGIPRRLAFDHRGRRYAYHETWLPPDPNKHLTLLFQDFFARFGIRGDIGHPRLARTPSLADGAGALVRSHLSDGPLLGVNPHATYPSKAWPPEHFEELIRCWHAATGRKALLFWGPGEKPATERLLERLGPDLAFTHESLSIRAFIELLARLDLFVTGDTGPMNLAWALGVPTVALFGPTTRSAVAPTGSQHLSLHHPTLECLQCHRETCDDGRCMTELTPALVWSAIREKYSSLFPHGGDR